MDDNGQGEVEAGLCQSHRKVVNLGGLVVQIVRRDPVQDLPSDKESNEADQKIEQDFNQYDDDFVQHLLVSRVEVNKTSLNRIT